MPADADAVQINVGLPVHGAEVQQQGSLPPFGRDSEAAFVPQHLVFGQPALYARERRLQGIGNEYLPVEELRLRGVGRAYGVIPVSVEVLPGGSHQRGTGVFGQRAGGIDLVGPGGFDFVACGLPCLRRSAQDTPGGEQKGEDGLVHSSFVVRPELAGRITNLAIKDESG